VSSRSADTEADTQAETQTGTQAVQERLDAVGADQLLLASSFPDRRERSSMPCPRHAT
jgi:hypothetical protein